MYTLVGSVKKNVITSRQTIFKLYFKTLYLQLQIWEEIL